MSVQITIEVPNQLENQLKNYRERIPEVLERGLREIMREEAVPEFDDQNAIIEFLASQPAPEKVVSLHPGENFQARASELLQKSKLGELSLQEDKELERIFILEHLVRLAKSHAHKQLAHAE